MINKKETSRLFSELPPFRYWEKMSEMTIMSQHISELIKEILTLIFFKQCTQIDRNQIIKYLFSFSEPTVQTCGSLSLAAVVD